LSFKVDGKDYQLTSLPHKVSSLRSKLASLEKHRESIHQTVSKRRYKLNTPDTLQLTVLKIFLPKP